jgi:hypothetical protein
MSDYLSAVIDELVPSFEKERGDWEAVLREAGRKAAEPRKWSPPRRLLLIAALVAVILIPLVALAATHDWWFFRFEDDFPPATEVTVVKTGVWDGTEWELYTYLSATNGICYGIAPSATARTTGEDAALACGPIAGLPEADSSKADGGETITYYAASSSEGLPAHIVGAVVASAAEVEVYLAGGKMVRTQTFAGPAELEAARLFATPLPDFPSSGEGRPRSPIRTLVGIDKSGTVVACLVHPQPPEDVPLSACR